MRKKAAGSMPRRRRGMRRAGNYRSRHKIARQANLMTRKVKEVDAGVAGVAVGVAGVAEVRAACKARETRLEISTVSPTAMYTPIIAGRGKISPMRKTPVTTAVQRDLKFQMTKFQMMKFQIMKSLQLPKAITSPR